MRRLAIVFGVLLIVAAVFRISADRAARQDFATFAQRLPGLTAERVTADPWRAEAIVRDLAFRHADFLVRVGRLTLPFSAPQSLFMSPAYAQEPGNKPGSSAPAPSGTVSAEDIEIAIGDIRYTIKNITLSGTNLTKAGLNAILDPTSTVPLAQRIAGLSASKISIPEIAVEMTVAGGTERDTYSDITLNDVTQGRVSNATVNTISSKVVSGEATVQSSYGPLTVTGFDLALAARFVSQARTNDAESPQTLYETVAVGSGKVVVEKSRQPSLEVDFGGFSGKDVKVRPLHVPIIAAAKMFAGPQSGGNPQAAAFLVDILDSIDIGSFDLSNMRIMVTNIDTPNTSTLGRFYLTQMADAKIGEMGIENLAVESNGTAVKIGGFALRGIDLSRLREWAQIALGQSPASASQAQGRSFLSDVLLTALDVDAPDVKGPGRIHVQLAKLDMSGADPVDGIPTQFSTIIDHLTLDLRMLTNGEFAAVTGMGYDTLDLSSQLAAHFDAAKHELGLDKVSLSGVDMGAVKIAADFSNVNKDLFSTDQAKVQAAALAMLAQRGELRIENAGLVERLIAWQAKVTGKTPDEIRANLINAAAIGVPTTLGNGPGAKAIGNAIAKFLATPKNLRIVAVAPQGLGAADFALVKDPNTLMSKLTIEAVADE